MKPLLRSINKNFYENIIWKVSCHIIVDRRLPLGNRICKTYYLFSYLLSFSAHHSCLDKLAGYVLQMLGKKVIATLCPSL